MINKDVFKSLARKKVNEILIWNWNDSTKEQGKKILNFLKIVKDIPQNYMNKER